jgi:hypothetical protein
MPTNATTCTITSARWIEPTSSTWASVAKRRRSVVVRHNLGKFAHRIQKVAKGVEPAVDDTVRKVAVVANQVLIMGTPVDTGQHRANWQVSIDTPIESVLEETNAQAAIDRNKAVIGAYRGEQRVLIIQNNAPAIQRLNDGWSAQAPAGFIEKGLQVAAREAGKRKVLR